MVSRFTMTFRALGACLLLALLASPRIGHAADVYLTSSSNAALNAALETMFEGFGHDVTLGVEHWQFDGTQSLAGRTVVYLQPNHNFNLDMPLAGQTALIDFVNGGGGLVTSEWTVWDTAFGFFNLLEPILPVNPTGSFSGSPSTTLSQATADPVLNAGLAAAFDIPLESIGGTETIFSDLKPGAVVYYNSSNTGAPGLVGGTAGDGQILQFSTVNGLGQISDPNFARLLSNSLTFVAGVSIISAAPEPGSIALLGFGLGGLALYRLKLRTRHRGRRGTPTPSVNRN
ncbi:MAG: PEP-CTERM sorting domain-containing protein [Capsulimonadales bacterium]|nr:PEP-CTERM sorting domain-containing protein [Capsulimonadales bacterium]